MGQLLTQSVGASLVVILTDSTGAAVTGVAYTAVTIQYRKEGQNSFTSKTITSPNWVELGLGVYTLAFTAAELNTLGSFTFVVTGASFTQYTSVSTIVAASVSHSSVVISTCVVTGSVFDAAGLPVPNASVVCTSLGAPLVYTGVVMGSDSIVAKTDSSGFFSVSLARLSLVDIAIPAASYRRTITVPNASSVDLFSGIP